MVSAVPAAGGLNVVAIIPARGGSKGIPHKNIKPFAGYPLIAYSIAAAKEDEVLLSLATHFQTEALNRTDGQ